MSEHNADIWKGFQLHGWVPDPKLNDDENSMDLVMLLTRNSRCLQGHMACVIVKPLLLSPLADIASHEGGNEITLLDRIVTVSINTSIFTERDSDNHAEINAIGMAAKLGKSTDGCTIFVTMPPCKRCFGAIVSAGIRRIVSTRPTLEPILSIAKKLHMDVDVLDAAASTARIAKFLPPPDREAIDRGRAQRCQEKRNRQHHARERKRKSNDLTE